MHVVDERDLSPEGAVAPSAGYGYIRNDYMPDGLPNERRFRITLSDPGRAVEFAAKLTLATANGARSEKTLFSRFIPGGGRFAVDDLPQEMVEYVTWLAPR